MTKKTFFAFLFATRVTRAVAWLNRDKVTILCYHSVTRQQEGNSDDPYKLLLPVVSFERQLDYLQTHYRIISLEEFVQARNENRKLPARAAILTFDDGQRNFLTVVAPLLIQRGLPATSFIITGEDFTHESSSRNGNWTPEDDETYLSWKEVRELSRLGVKFGSHTCTHSSLPEIPVTEARSEMEKSLSALRARLGSERFPLAFPHGRTSEGISRLSRSVGYSCALTSKLGQNKSNADLFALRRTVIASDDDLPTFAARVSGLTYWYGRIAALLGIRPTVEPELSDPQERVLAEGCSLHETY